MVSKRNHVLSWGFVEQNVAYGAASDGCGETNNIGAEEVEMLGGSQPGA